MTQKLRESTYTPRTALPCGCEIYDIGGGGRELHVYPCIRHRIDAERRIAAALALEGA
jgi:hypothetical protein